VSLHDRDYYRDDEPASWAEWIDARGTALIIGITCTIFLIQLFSSPREAVREPRMSRQEFREHYADYREVRFDGVRKFGDLYLPAILSGEIWRFATAFWVHDIANLVGVIFGMLLVYFVGKELQVVIGGREFFAFYWFSGLFVMMGLFLGKLFEKYAFPGQPIWPFDSSLGAAGSMGPVTAVLVLFALKFWDQPIRFMFAITLPAWGAVALIVGLTILLSLASFDRGEILAMNGFGIFSAWIYHRSGTRIIDWLPSLSRGNQRSERRLSRLKLVPPPDDEPTDPGPLDRGRRRGEYRPSAREQGVVVVDEQLEAKLDRVLDKVAKSGTDSLSPDERSVLLKASEVYKKRRGEASN
jgi:hypothetical protein